MDWVVYKQFPDIQGQLQGRLGGRILKKKLFFPKKKTFFRVRVPGRGRPGRRSGTGARAWAPGCARASPPRERGERRRAGMCRRPGTRRHAGVCRRAHRPAVHLQARGGAQGHTGARLRVGIHVLLNPA